MRLRTLLMAAVCLTALAVPAWAEDVVDEHAPAFGLHGVYSFVPNSFLSLAYSKHTSISAVGYGAWLTYGFKQYDLAFQVNNWSAQMGNGEWLSQGATIDNAHWITTKGLGAADFSASILWKWRVHPAVEPFIGPTLGVAFLYGKVNEDDANADQTSPNFGKPLGQPEKKTIPPVVPNVGFLTGCRFYPTPNFRISVDLGIYLGFSAGLSLGYAF
jgi:hypothetical protein